MPQATVSGRYGSVRVGWTDAGVCRVILLSREEADRAVSFEGERASGDVLKTLEGLLDYLDGRPVTFEDVRLDYSGASAFRRKVWETVRRIPYGQIRTYGWIAKRMGKPRAARAVGTAMARNPFPIIVPCHRVVGADFRLGRFSAGIEWKRHLHAIEGTALRR